MAARLSANGGDAVECGGDFDLWLGGVSAEAATAGIMPATLERLDGRRPSEKVLAIDGSQRVVSQEWVIFARRAVNGYGLKTDRQ